MMLAKVGGKEILKSKDYIFEPKVDGYRAFCIKEKNKVRFISRSGRDITENFPEFKFEKKIKAQKCTIDGEIVVLDDEGVPSFQLMQDRARDEHRVVFMAFDILDKDGKDLKELSIEDRKKVLSEVIVEDETLKVLPFSQNGEKVWKEVVKSKLEGIMAKRKGSSYVERRSSEWVKVKEINTIDCVIIGFTQEKRGISSLGLGLYDNDGVLKFIGKVGTGFSEKMLEELGRVLKKKEKLKEGVIRETLPKNIVLVIPNKVCEIKFQEVTQSGKLRIPVFLRLRDDKLPKECLISQLDMDAKIKKGHIKYEKKRDFKKTPEPSFKMGVEVLGRSKSLIYVIQKHYATRLHYDFRLEYKGVLLSWAVPKGMPEIHEKRLAIMTEDHPLAYAKFHGTIPKGNYGAGKVEIWDKGKYVNITVKDGEQLELGEAIKKGHFNVYLKGKKLQGTYSFIRMKDQSWLITKKADSDEDEGVEEGKVNFKNLDKELDKGVRKRDLIDYYKKIWHLMLPHIEKRAITLYRFPSGIKGNKFYQKNAPKYFPEYISRKEVRHEKRVIEYPVVEDGEGILYLANQVAEIHVMTSKVEKMGFPDKMVFDLDPSEVDMKRLKGAAKKLKTLIESLGLSAYIMTTGGKGYHIVVPIKPEFDNEKVRKIALTIAEALVKLDPEHLTTELLKSKRKERIFIDINRNSPMQTSIAPYSVRVKEGITIAAPIFWEDLSKVNPNRFNVKNYKVEDPWKDFYENPASLKKILG